MYKPSIFNIVIPVNSQRYLIYNTLRGTLYEVDDEAREALQSPPRLKHLEPKAFDLALRNGLLVPENSDELKLFKIKFDKFKYDTRSLLFTLMTTYDCNLNCPYCYEDSQGREKGELNLDQAKTIVSFITKEVVLRNSRILSLFLFGGEPLLRLNPGMNIAKILREWAKDNNISFHLGLITNATLLTSDVMEEFSGFDNIFTEITLDGPEQCHNRKRIYKDEKGTYEDIMGALLRCRNSLFKVKIRVNIDRENYKEIPLLFEDMISRGLGGSRLSLSVLAPLTKACSSYRPYLHDEEIISCIPALWEKALELGFRLDIAPKSTPVYCGSITESAFIIDPLLDIYKCYGSVGLKEHRVGHLMKNGECRYEFPYYDLMSRDPFLFRDKNCLECPMLPMCGGGCAFASFRREGHYHAGSCDFLSRIFDKRVALYWKYKDRINSHP